VCVLDGKLSLAKPARADDHDFACQDGRAVPEERIMELPERVHTSDEFLAQRTVWHAMPLRQRTGRRQLRPVGERGFVAWGTAKLPANAGVVGIELRGGGDIDGLDWAEEAGEVGEVAAGAQREREDLTCEPVRIVGEAAGSLDLGPFGIAEIRRQYEDDKLALIESTLESPDPVLAPPDGLYVEKARDAVASQAAMEFGYEVFVLAAVTEEDAIGRGRHR